MNRDDQGLERHGTAPVPHVLQWLDPQVQTSPVCFEVLRSEEEAITKSQRRQAGGISLAMKVVTRKMASQKKGNRGDQSRIIASNPTMARSISIIFVASLIWDGYDDIIEVEERLVSDVTLIRTDFYDCTSEKFSTTTSISKAYTYRRRCWS